MTPHGEVVISRHFDPETGRDLFRIERAAPRALIAEELLTEIKRGDTIAHIDGDVLTLRDDFGQKFIYRIGRFVREQNAYEMEWPD